MDIEPVPPLPAEPTSTAPEDASASSPRAPRRRVPRWLPRLGVFAGGVLAAFLAIALAGALFPPPAPLRQQDVKDSIAQALASQTPGPALSEAAYAAIQPSLVLVQAVDGAPAVPGGSSTPAPSPSTAPPTASPGPAASAGPVASAGPTASGGPGSSGPIVPPPNGSLGSGVIVDDAGDVMTSLHIVADAVAIQVTFPDGTKTSARIAVREVDKDIAVLHPDQPPSGFVPATLGNPRSVHIGSDVYVVGNPFGLYGSLSAGVVSGLDRTFQEPDGGPVLRGLIQVDAAVNPGNSGGPLVDRAGRVLGIVTGLVNPTKQDFFVGIGLAVPIDVAAGGAGLPQY